MLELIKNRWYWCVGPVIIASVYMILNYKRFGNIFEFGHNYLPEFTSSDSEQFSISYLWENLNKLLHFPDMNPENGAIAFPNAEGFAFYIAAPIFLVIIGVWLYALLGKSEAQYGIFDPCSYHHGLPCGFHMFAQNSRRMGLRKQIPFGSPTVAVSVFARLEAKKTNLCQMDHSARCFWLLTNLIGTVAVYNYWI